MGERWDFAWAMVAKVCLIKHDPSQRSRLLGPRLLSPLS